jgi:ribonuclease HI
MPWVRRILRGTPVFARVQPDGSFVADADGRVDVTYKYDGSAKIYRAAAKNLDPAPELDLLPDLERVEQAHPVDEIVVYTDGACSGNPGPMGIGVVVLDRGKRREVSEYLGEGTNNIAELTAVERALDLIPEPERERPIAVHSDSTYVIGLLARGFKAKANAELVERLRGKTRRFRRLRFVKVEGHAGVPENERCDVLARQAVTSRATSVSES